MLTLHGPASPRRGADAGELGLIEDGSVLISGQTISAVGATRRVENLAAARNASEIDVSGRLVMPGLVDPHVHVPELSGRCTNHTLEFRVTRLQELWLRHGTTAVETKVSGDPRGLKVMERLDGARTRIARTFLAGYGTSIAAGWPELQQEYVHTLRQSILPAIRQRRMSGMLEVFCDPRGLYDHAATALIAAAREMRLEVKVFGDQSGRAGAAKMAAELGARSVSGLNYANAADVSALSRSQIPSLLLPGLTSQGTTDRYPPARDLLFAGVPVALGTGFQLPANSAFSMQTVIGLACAQMKMSPAEAIVAATINSAYVAGLGNRVGSLEFGKDADLIVLAVSDYRDIPAYFGANLVEKVIRQGTLAYSGGVVHCANA